MRKLIACEFLSLDGFMAGKEGEEMDFVTENFLPEMEADIATEYDNTDTFLMGKTTYESLSQYWPNVTTHEEPLADYMNNMEKVVFSSSLSGKLSWQNSRLAYQSPAEEVTLLKSEANRNIMIIGSASIVQQLSTQDLIDEYHFLLFPTILGKGKPLFKDVSNRLKLKLVYNIAYKNGVQLLKYKSLNFIGPQYIGN